MASYDIIGHSPPRIDGIDKATGRAEFSGDIRLPGMLCGAILRSPHPHARLVKIDVSRAEKLPGVKAVITGKDTAGIRYGTLATMMLPADEHPLAEDRVRFVGAEVAALAAVDEETARQALELIAVEYELLPAVFNPDEALQADAPRLHEIDFSTVSGDPRHKNLSGRTFLEIGNVEQGFAAADYVREDEYQTQVTAHCALEPHLAVASYELSGKLNMWLSSMGVFYKRKALAAGLGLPTGQVRIHKTYVGGAFGGKIALYSYEFCAAMLSMRTGRPVQIGLSREEVFSTTRQRHPMNITVKTGVRKNGRILAQDIKVVADNGAYRSTGPLVVFLAHQFNTPVYRVPNYRYEGLAVYTNNPMRGPQRGHGAPQIRFAVDSQLDTISRQLGLDIAQVMLKNVRHKGEVLFNGDVLDSCGLEECVTRAASYPGWRNREDPSAPSPWTRGLRTSRSEKAARPGQDGGHRKGTGISLCCMFNGAPIYPFASAATVNLADDGGITLFTGTTEMGQGTETLMAQIAAEELGVPIGAVRVVSGDTELCPVDMGNYLSGGAFVTGNAVRAAAADARNQLLQVASRQLEAAAVDLVIKDGRIFVKGSPARSLSVSEAVLASLQKQDGNPVVGRGFVRSVPYAERYPDVSAGKGRYTNAYSFAAQVAEVDVDVETGRVRLLRADTIYDCGYPLNPALCVGQVQGCVSMAQGQGLTEEVILDRGRVLNPSFGAYGLPCALDAVGNRVDFVESIEPRGPYGAKEIGEGAVAGMMAAIGNAVYDAVGVRINTLPITAEKVLEALERSGKEPF